MPAARASSSPGASFSFCGATILTFFLGGLDAGYHDEKSQSGSTMVPISHVTHTYLGRIFGRLDLFKSRYSRLNRPGTR